jgi:hypothetical protein
MKTPKGYRPTTHENGLLAVDQGEIHGWPVSFNPDDDRFYVHEKNQDADTRATFKDYRNAVQYCRTHGEAA